MNTTPQRQRPAVLGDYLEACRRRLPLILTIGPFVLLLAIYLAFGLTPQYESTATVMLEASTVPKNMIETSVISYSDQQIEIVQARVLTQDTLKELVQKYDPYPDEKNWSVAKKAKKLLDSTSIEKVDPVTMNPVVESNAFQLHYRNPDPERAAETTNRLAQLFLTYNQRLRSEAAEQATSFLKQQSEGINSKIAEIDGEIAKLKVKAGDAFPELQGRNQAAVDRNQHDLDQLQQQILAAEARESMLALQLSQTSPNLMTQSGDMTDLATVRAQLAEAEQRYTADNPVVKRLRSAVETLVKQNAKGSKPGNANNPQYLAIQSQLDSAHRELAGLRGQAAQARKQMDVYSDYLKRTPGIEREYADILRRREVAQNEYQQLHDKLQNAQLAQSFETEQRGERFTMLRPPYAANAPVFPNRLGVILLGIALAGALSAGAVAFAEMTDSTVRNSRDLPDIDGVAVLATIPVIANSDDQRRQRRRFGTYAIAGGALVTLDLIAFITAMVR